MNLEVIEKNERKLVLILDGISIEMVNAFRRIILTETPVMAIDEVIILKNDSPLYDEIISHRLGLIPLKTDLEVYKLPKECECGGFGCPLCQVSLTCEITNTSNKPLDIFSGDLNSNDPKIIPVNPKIPIVKIDKNDKVIIEAYAILGLAKDHVKWQAASNTAFRYYPVIKFDNKKCKDCPDKCLVGRMCPKKLYTYSEKEKTSVLVDDYWKTCNLCKACEDNCAMKTITVSWKDNTYIFSIESDGVLPFNVLIKKAFEIFTDKINEFTSKLEEIEIESI